MNVTEVMQAMMENWLDTLEQSYNLDVNMSSLKMRGRLVDFGESTPLVIFAHGFGSLNEDPDPNDETFSDGFADIATALNVSGFSTFRFLFYEQGKRLARSWWDATLETYVTDLDTVVEHFRQKWPKRTICVAGHSYGASAIIMSKNQHFNAAVLYDPTIFSDGQRQDPSSWSYDATTGLCHNVNSPDWLVTKARLDSEKGIDLVQAMRNFKRPFKLIVAKQTEVWKNKQALYEASLQLKNLVYLDAPHAFEGARHLLAGETINWLQSLS